MTIFIPNLSISIRGLHDIGKSGWWVLISLIPIIGWIWIIILLAIEGENKPNKYGPVPGKVESRAENKNENQQ